MGKLKFTLSNIFYWLGLIASCLLLENVAFLSSSPEGGLNDTHFFMLLVLGLVSYLAYFIFDHIRNKSSVDFFLLGVLSLAFGCGLIAIWTFKSVSFISENPAFNFNYSQDIWDQSKHSLSLLVFIVTLYATLFFFNKNYPSIRKLRVIFLIILAICYFAIIYSFIAEWDAYVYNLTVLPPRPLPTKSIFWNENMFSCMLLMGIASSIGLNIYKKNALSYISIAVLIIDIILVGSLTAIVVGLATLLIYFLVEIILTISKKQGLGVFFLSLYLTFIAAAVVVYACALRFDMGTFSSLCTYLHNNLREADYATLTFRTFTWGETFKYLGDNPLSLLFGVGFRNANHVIGGFWYAYRQMPSMGVLSAHSGYIQILMNFGIVGLLLYFGLLVYFIYSFIRLLKTDTRFALLYFIIAACFFAYGVMESVLFFIPNTLGILVGIVFFLPMINKWKHTKHKELGDQAIEVEEPKVMEPSLITKSVAKVIMSLIALGASFFIFPIALENETIKYILINGIVILVICLFTLPIIISSFSVKRSRKAFIANCSINLTLVGFGFTYLILTQFRNSLHVSGDAKWIYPVILIIILVGEAIIIPVAKRITFKDYLQTFVGASKNSFMGLIGVGAVILIGYFMIDRIDTLSPLTYIIYPAIVLLFYYLFSYFVPFKDTVAIINHYNQIEVHSLKRDVLFDRLGNYNEKRKD